MIVIIGGGIVGLTLAAGLARAGISVTVVENRRPILQWEEKSWDARVSAMNMASQKILEHIGVWQMLPVCSVSPLRALQVWDAAGGGEIRFDSAEIGEAQLGFIVENRALIKVLWTFLETLKNVTLLYPRQPLKMTPDENHCRLELDDHTELFAQLVVGADGAHSWVREKMNMATRESSYEQKALIAVVQNEKPHQDTGWQSFLPTGPLGVLPLSDPSITAIVWSNTLPAAERLIRLDPAELNHTLSTALNHRLGQMRCLTPPVDIPLIMRHAEHYVGPRIALIGDAAHTIHPLAGQGVNLGLMDAAVLTEVMTQAHQKKQDIGALRTLRRYERARKGDNTIMLAVMRGFKELFGAQSPWLTQWRSQGLNLTNHLDFVKNEIMRRATGLR